MLNSTLPRLLLACLLTAPLAGCEQLGLETPAQTAAIKDAEGRAIGGACRHAGRALEDCYQINPRAAKASIYNGWRDMDAYMRENKLDVVEPEFEPKGAPTKAPRSEEAAEAKPKLEKPAEKKAEPAAEAEPEAPASEKPATADKGKPAKRT